MLLFLFRGGEEELLLFEPAQLFLQNLLLLAISGHLAENHVGSLLVETFLVVLLHEEMDLFLAAEELSVLQIKQLQGAPLMDLFDHRGSFESLGKLRQTERHLLGLQNDSFFEGGAVVLELEELLFQSVLDVLFEDDSLLGVGLFFEYVSLDGVLSILDFEAIEGFGLHDLELIGEGESLLLEEHLLLGDGGEDLEVLLAFLGGESFLHLIEEELGEDLVFFVLQGLQLHFHLEK